MKRCAIAMSGGVDSSVTALLMQRAGYECMGVTMQLHPEATVSRGGCSQLHAARNNLRDIEDAKQACSKLQIEHHVIKLESLFQTEVIEPFVQAYCAGLTPNPCINCNTHLKFDALMQWAQQQSCDCLATGHYARLEGTRLFKAKDINKDQSYVLYTLTQEQRAFVQLPLGNHTKEEVRAFAHEAGFSSAEKLESQDICFIPNGDYAGFIEEQLRVAAQASPAPGDLITEDGTVVGSHRGVHHYTIGQRKGLGISYPEPLYVTDIDADRAVIQVGTKAECGRQKAYLSHTNFLVDLRGKDAEICTAKHRYRGKEHQAHISQEKDERWVVTFLEKQRDLTCGQSLVLYEGEQVLGGGLICATE